MLPKIGKSQSLAEQAYEALKKAIVNNTLKPKEILREEALAASLGISRTPLRAALRRLQFEKLIVVDSSKHAFVTDVKPETMNKVFTFRFALEPVASRVACIRIGKEGLSRIDACLKQHENCIKEQNLDKIIACELKFTTLIAEATENSFLMDGIAVINTYMQRYIAFSRTASEDVTYSLVEHRMILDALAGDEPKAAEECTRHHLANIVARFGLKNVF